MVDVITIKAKDTSYLPLLDFFRKIGIFPCKKTIDDTTKKVGLAPVHGKVQLLTYIFISVILCVFGASSFWLLLSSIENDDVLEGITESFKVGTAMRDSEFDFKVSCILFFFNWIFHFTTIASSVTSKNELCKARNYLLQEAKYDSKVYFEIKKSCNWFFIQIGVWITFAIAFWIAGNLLNLVQFYNISVLIVLPIAFYFSVLCLWFLSPLIAFNIFVCDLIILWIPWTIALQGKLEAAASCIKLQNIQELLQESEKLQFAIELISRTISKGLFWFFTMIMTSATCGSYLVISFFLDQEEFTLPISLNLLGLGGFVGLYIRFAYGYCTLSQSTKDAMNSIKKALLKLDINPDMNITINGSRIRAKHLQMTISSDFEEFQGFHGNHFSFLAKLF